MMILQREIDDARDYCVAIGADPEEKVWSSVGKDRHCIPLYQWMIGASRATARGAMDLSPRQQALLESQRSSPSDSRRDAASKPGDHSS